MSLALLLLPLGLALEQRQQAVMRGEQNPHVAAVSACEDFPTFQLSSHCSYAILQPCSVVSLEYAAEHA